MAKSHIVINAPIRYGDKELGAAVDAVVAGVRADISLGQSDEFISDVALLILRDGSMNVIGGLYAGRAVAAMKVAEFLINKTDYVWED